MAMPPTPGLSQPGISVIAEGVVQTEPNIAHISVSVEATNPSLAAAQQEGGRRMAAVIQRLHAAGIPPADIQTSSLHFGLNPDYHPGSGTPRGFKVQHTVEVRTTDVPGLGALIDQVVGAGATQVSAIRFSTDNLAALREQARDLAMQNARAKAEQLARAAGAVLGWPLLVEESEAGEGGRRARMVALASGVAAESTPIQPGEVQVRTVVRVIWAIQQA